MQSVVVTVDIHHIQIPKVVLVVLVVVVLHLQIQIQRVIVLLIQITLNPWVILVDMVIAITPELVVAAVVLVDLVKMPVVVSQEEQQVMVVLE